MANVLQVHAAEDIGVGNVILAVLPYFHIYGLTVAMNLGLYVGATQVVFRKFEVDLYIRCLEKYRATHLYIAPPIAIALTKNPDSVLKYQRDSVKKIKSGAAPMGRELQNDMMKVFPTAHMRQGYGLTETSPVTHLQPHGSTMMGSIGKLLSNTEARIVDPISKEDLGTGLEGELWLRGPQVMLGYQKAEDTAKVMEPDSWFKTGDIAKYNEDGYFFITDRLKELIKVKGFQVAPAELESLLLSHPDVQDAVVFGVPHEFDGEVPKAHIQLKASVKPSVEKAMEIQAYVVNVVSSYKQLRGGVRFVETIPKSASGKLLRRLSRDIEKISAEKETI